jgi:hypothetical protein
MRSGDVVSAVISHVPAVSCIQLPVFEIIEAIRRSRKTRRRNGSQAGTGSSGWTISGMAVHQRNQKHDSILPVETSHYQFLQYKGGCRDSSFHPK